MQQKDVLKTVIIKDFANIACPNCSVIGLFHYSLVLGDVRENKRTASSYLVCGHCGHCAIVRSSLLEEQEVENFLDHYRTTNKVVLEVENFRATSFNYRGKFIVEKSNTCEECKNFLIHCSNQHSPGILVPLIKTDLLTRASSIDLVIIKGCSSCSCYLSHSIVNNFICDTERAIFTELSNKVNKLSFYAPDMVCKGPTYFGETGDIINGKYTNDEFNSPLNMVGEFRLHSQSVLSINYNSNDTISDVVKSMFVGNSSSAHKDKNIEDKSRVIFIEV